MVEILWLALAASNRKVEIRLPPAFDLPSRTAVSNIGLAIKAPIVRVEQGLVQGKTVPSPSGSTYYSFQGIPYAKPPVGELRYKAPAPSEPWQGIRNATTEGNLCPQVDYVQNGTIIGDEDCLFLNVYSPKLTGNLPVMFYIHGGSFRFGSGGTWMYGPDYLVEKDVIVVTINYRLGPLGFLCLNTKEVPGNAALKDMATALNWVRANIASFGGDHHKITVFGESSGSVATALFLVSPLTRNNFAGAILQSSTPFESVSFTKDPLEKAKSLANQIGCSTNNKLEIYNCLMAATATKLTHATDELNIFGGIIEQDATTVENIFAAVIEQKFRGVDAFLSEDVDALIQSSCEANIPIIIGTNELEYAQEPNIKNLLLFVPEQFNIDKTSDKAKEIEEKINDFYFGNGNFTEKSNWDRYFELLSDAFANADMQRFINALLETAKKPIYRYKFDYVGKLNIVQFTLGRTVALDKAGHSDELGYLFKNNFQDQVTPTEQDKKIRERMLTLWTNFAKFGNPTPSTTNLLDVKWLPVTKENNYFYHIGSQLYNGKDPEKERIEFWEQLYEEYYKRPEPSHGCN